MRVAIMLEEKEIALDRCFKFLRSIFKSSGDTQQDVTNRIKCV